MLDAVLAPLEHLMTSWWIYPALFGLCTLDAFVPVFPSEAPLILAGVLVLALLVALLTRGLILTWDGWITVPQEATYTPPPVVNTHCGDYCGSDAGLL